MPRSDFERERDLLEVNINSGDLQSSGFTDAGEFIHTNFSRDSPTVRRLVNSKVGLALFVGSFGLCAALLSLLFGFLWPIVFGGPSGLFYWFGIIGNTVTIAFVACLIGFLVYLPVPYLFDRLTDSGRGAQTVWIAGQTDDLRIAYESESNSVLQEAYQKAQIPSTLVKRRMSLASLLALETQGDVDESVHLMELGIVEEKDKDNLIASDFEPVSDGVENPEIPLSAIAKAINSAPVPILCQIVVQPRKGDQGRIDDRIDAIRKGADKSLLMQIPAAVVTFVEQVMFDDTEPMTSDTELSPADERRCEQLRSTNGYTTFGVNIRAVAFDPENEHEQAIIAMFERIQNHVEIGLPAQLSASRKVYQPPNVADLGSIEAWEREQLLDRFWGQKYTRQPVYLSGFRRRRYSHIIADTLSVWNYLALSDSTAADTGRELGATPPDQQPPERPQDDKLNRFRGSADASFDEDVD